MGTSIYQVAPTIPRLGSDEPGRELVDTTKALYRARELAMNRLEEEADLLGADGVIGVRLTINLALDPQRLQWQQYRTWTKWAKKMGFRRPLDGQVPTGGWFPGWPQLAARQWQQWCGYMGW